MILGEAFKFGFDPLAWEIIPRFHIGALEISPHGIGIAIGYLAGAQLMVRRARKRGGPDENDIWNSLFWALIGAIIGARLGYIFGHVSEVTDGGDDILGLFRVWEGGISLIGGITGAVLLALPYMLRKKMGFWRMVDLAAPGLALGIVIGRIGDLVIGDHLGKPTNFALGWRCLGSDGDPPSPASVYREAVAQGERPSLGCFDLTLHQTAIYDFLSTLLLLALLLWLGKKMRRPGFMALTFTAWYGTMRMITDFLRVDKRYLGLTGSQIMALLVVVASVYLLARYRGAPPRYGGVEGPPGADDPLPDAESEQQPAVSPPPDHTP
ncbi:MAG: prolipoprotein diacylglyceryl transferase [Actinomycetota bacterium]